MRINMESYSEHLSQCKSDVRTIISDILMRCKLHKPSMFEKLFKFRKITLECWQHRDCGTTYVYRTLDNKPILFDIIHAYGTPATITIKEIDEAFKKIDNISFNWSDPYGGFNEFKCSFYICLNHKIKE